jgi:sec-independent protein translocase protein TatA
MPNLGGWELVILIGILVLLFGAKRLPDMARSIGQSARVFKGEMKGMKNEDGEATADDKPAEPPAAAPPASPAQPAQPAALPSAQQAQSQPTQSQPTQAAPTRASQPGSSSNTQ